MRKVKVLVAALCTMVLIVGTVVGTLAYLTDRDSVTNTFTVGKVVINLDETDVDVNGDPVSGASRVDGNEYHLIPGKSYVKDPTLTVLKDSEESYVRMIVTINCYKALTDIFGDDFLPQYFVEGWDSATWVSTKIVDVDIATDTATYEFRYKDSVKPAQGEDLVLDALFDKIVMPGTVTGDQLATLADLEIVIEGHAIQKATFDTADAAWQAFEDQMG